MSRWIGLLLLLPLAGGTVREEFHATYALPRDGRVIVRAVAGDVRIRAWDSAAVRVDAVRQAPDSAALAATRILVWRGPALVRVQTDQDTLPRTAREATIVYELTVPRGARLDTVSVDRGDVDVEGVTGGMLVIVDGRVTKRVQPTGR